MTNVLNFESVFDRLKDSDGEATVTLSSGRAWHMTPTVIGSDYVAGETTVGEPQTLVFVFAHIEAVSGFTCSVWPQGSISRSSFVQMVRNLSRLAKPVVVHTQHRHWSGVITGTDSEHLSMVLGNGDSVVLALVGIHWIAVDTLSGLDRW